MLRRWFKRRRATIPLDRDATGRFLPYIIAILTLLATLILMLALGLSGSLGGWRSGLEGRATVQILPLDGTATPMNERVQLAIEILQKSGQVRSAAPVADARIAELLAPWLGQGALPEDLPVPALIDVELQPKADLPVLHEALKSVAGASFDDHGTWLKQVRQLARAGVTVSMIMVLLIGGAATLVLILLVRAGLSMHKDVIELLHLVGATDAFIARQFRSHILLVSAQGALLGGLLAALVLFWLSGLAEGAGFNLALDWRFLPLMPLGFVLLAGYTAQRVTCNRLAELA